MPSFDYLSRARQIKQFNGTNILDGFNYLYNTNLDIGIENINNKQKYKILI